MPLSPSPIARGLVVLLGLLPFVNPWRFPPRAEYWQEWLTAALVGLWLAATALRRGRAVAAPWDAVALTLGGLAALTVVQAALRLTPQPLNAMAVALALALATAGNRAVASLDATERQRWVGDWALGVLLALYVNAFGALLEAIGLTLLGGQLVVIVPTSRTLGLLGQPNQLADVAVFAMAAAVLRHRATLAGRAVLLLHVAVAGALCAATVSRSGLVVWLLGTAIGLWQLWRNATDRAGRSWALASAVAGLLPFVIVPWLRAGGDNAGVAISVLRTSTAGRWELLSDAWQLWLAHPLLGVGYGGYASARFFDLDGPLYTPHATHAHNLFAQVAAEWGTAGLLVLSLPAGWLLWRAWQDRAARATRPARGAALNARQVFIATVLLTVAVHSLVELPLWFCYFLLPCAMLAGAWRNSPASVVEAIEVPPTTAVSPVFSRAPIAVALTTLALTALTGLDYLRLQDEALAAAAVERGAAPRPALEVIARTGQISALTAYPTFADLLYLRALDNDPVTAPLVFDVAERAIRGLPAPEMIATYVTYLDLTDRRNEAVALLRRFAPRNPQLHEEVIARLMLAANRTPSLHGLLARLEPLALTPAPAASSP